jgi:hypothetical protein
MTFYYYSSEHLKTNITFFTFNSTNHTILQAYGKKGRIFTTAVWHCRNNRFSRQQSHVQQELLQLVVEPSTSEKHCKSSKPNQPSSDSKYHKYIYIYISQSCEEMEQATIRSGACGTIGMSKAHCNNNCCIYFVRSNLFIVLYTWESWNNAIPESAPRTAAFL